MAAEDKKISSLPEWLYEDIVGIANIVAAYAGGNYRIAMETIRQYVLGNREIGGTGSGDIVTTTDEQILIEKRLDSPSFNDDVPLNSNVTATQMNFLSGLDFNVRQVLNGIGSDILTIENIIGDLNGEVDALLNKFNGLTATTAELNKLHGVTASTAEINHLTGVTSSIQTQINNIISQLQGITYRIYHYSPGVISGVTLQTINEATLREEYGISNQYRVNPDSISVSVYKSDGSGRWYLLPPADVSASEGAVFFTTTTAGIASQTVLNSINITLLSAESYRIVINYKVLGLAGV